MNRNLCVIQMNLKAPGAVCCVRGFEAFMTIFFGNDR